VVSDEIEREVVEALTRRLAANVKVAIEA